MWFVFVFGPILVGIPLNPGVHIPPRKHPPKIEAAPKKKRHTAPEAPQAKHSQCIPLRPSCVVPQQLHLPGLRLRAAGPASKCSPARGSRLARELDRKNAEVVLRVARHKFHPPQVSPKRQMASAAPFLGPVERLE